MRKTLLFAIAGCSVLAATAQPLVNFDNNVPGVLRAPIYGPDPEEPWRQTNGNTPTGIPLGSTVYRGPLLSGTGFTAELWGGPLAALESDLVPLGTTTFRTGVAAGYFVPVDLPVLPVSSGQRMTLQVRAWDNAGGTIATWAELLAHPTAPRGSSLLFSPPSLLGQTSLNLIGLTSFNILIVPEPAVMSLLAMGGLLLAVRRRN